MTLLDAKEYHPEKERKKKARIISAIVLILVLALIGWWNRFWPEKRIADKFFSALQKQDFEAAYGIYYSDPSWQQHPQNHSQYPFNEFKQDWGPGGQWGLVNDSMSYDPWDYAHITAFNFLPFVLARVGKAAGWVVHFVTVIWFAALAALISLLFFIRAESKETNN